MGRQARFRLDPAIVEAMDVARGKVSRPAYVQAAVLLKLAIGGFRMEPPNQRACAWCGEPFEALRASKRFCSGTCRAQASLRRLGDG